MGSLSRARELAEAWAISGDGCSITLRMHLARAAHPRTPELIALSRDPEAG